MAYNTNTHEAYLIMSYSPTVNIDTTYDLIITFAYPSATASNTCSVENLYGATQTFTSPSFVCAATTGLLTFSTTNLKSAEST